MDNSQNAIPIMCDMSTAPDTEEERLAEYRRLFATALTGRERTAAGFRFRFRAQEGVAEWVRDLAAREKACCAFFSFDITAADGEVVWDVSLVAPAADNDVARGVLEEFFLLSETFDGGVETLKGRLAARDLTFPIISREAGPGAR